jgi:hypothetical protein
MLPTQVIIAFETGDTVTAQRLLTQLLRQDVRHEQAWLLMAQCVEDEDKKRTCLERVLALNPDNSEAQRLLSVLNAPLAPPATHPAPPFQPRPFALSTENQSFTPQPFALEENDDSNEVQDAIELNSKRPPWLRNTEQ